MLSIFDEAFDVVIGSRNSIALDYVFPSFTNPRKIFTLNGNFLNKKFVFNANELKLTQTTCRPLLPSEIDTAEAIKVLQIR